ncbi:MAG: hypothetical protein Q9160_006581 [Pyrenula sp. 1 TL-2023]
MTSDSQEASSDSAKASPGSESTTNPTIFTPPESEATFPASHLSEPSKRRTSPSPLRLSTVPNLSHADLKTKVTGQGTQRTPLHSDTKDRDLDYSDDDLDLELDEMASSRPPMHRPTDGRSEQPLLKDKRGRPSYDSPSTRPPFASRRSTFRSRSPEYVDPNATRKKWTYAGFFLVLSLVSFVIQTETAVYIQHTLKWKKAYCMLYLTHGSWSLLWPAQLLILRIQKRKLSWKAFWRRHKYILRTTAQMVKTQELHLTSSTSHASPIPYMLKTTAIVTTALTVAGGSWYVAVDLTTPSDLTAIYNCSAFFAYVFSILLLNDKLRADKIFSVLLAIIGVLVVAYGDKETTKHPGHSGGAVGKPHDSPDASEAPDTPSRALGNLVIGVGSVLYGLYEVLYKRQACPPEGTSPGRGMIFANTFGSLIGLFTLTVLWIPLPILHFTGLEPFELPRGQAAALLAVSTLSNAIFSGSFLVLMSLTSPVLSSVAALLTIFLVAITDWFLTGKPLSGAAIAGGTLIIVAFLLLSWATYREMDQERKEREAEEGVDSSDEE